MDLWALRWLRDLHCFKGFGRAETLVASPLGPSHKERVTLTFPVESIFEGKRPFLEYPDRILPGKERLAAICGCFPSIAADRPGDGLPSRAKSWGRRGRIAFPIFRESRIKGRLRGAGLNRK